jgi:hypothetical protein
MRRGIVVLLVGVAACAVAVTASAQVNIDRDEAIELFNQEILPGLGVTGDYIAFAYYVPLRPGDELGPYAPDPVPSGVSLPHVVPYDLGNQMWFFWVDRAPLARYSHPTTFVLSDAFDGSHVAYDEAWWPVLNGRSLWTDKADYWDIENWSAAYLSSIQGDYGDAPEDKDTYYPGPTVLGEFPTLYDPGSPPGDYIVHRFPRDVVFLGDVTEGDTATDDPDARIVNEDVDDGVILAPLIPCTEETLRFEVTVQPDADHDNQYYFNLLIDWDRNGRWEGYSVCAPTEHFPDGIAPEWAIRNLRLDEAPDYVGPGFHGEIETPVFLAGPETEDLWMRATISTRPVDETVHVPVELDGPGWDGSGYFLYGETEDYGPKEPAVVVTPPSWTPAPPPTAPGQKVQCALVVNGWGEDESGYDDFMTDTQGMTSIFRAAGDRVVALGPGGDVTSSLGVTVWTIATPQAIEDAVKSFVQCNCCRELVVYITCHGSPNTLWIGGQPLTDTRLAAILSLFPGDVYVLIDACYSGSFIPRLSELDNARKVKTATNGEEYGWFDRDGPFDPNPWDEGSEWTSGYREDLEELLDPENYETRVAVSAEEQDLPEKFVLLNKAYESAVEKDDGAIEGATHPQNWHREEEPPQDVELDFGDAPDPTYPTFLASDGARHVIVSRYYLGYSIDPESDGQPTALADGDDQAGWDDEDGVTFSGGLVTGSVASIVVVASSVGFLDAWIDFNRDGDWADPGEQIFAGQALSQGSNTLSFTVPGNAQGGDTYARFRFSSCGGLSYVGGATDGEVEDYTVGIEEGWVIECIELLARNSADEYKMEGWYQKYIIQFSSNRKAFFEQEIDIYMDSPWVSSEMRRCGLDLWVLWHRSGNAERNRLANLFWEFYEE